MTKLSTSQRLQQVVEGAKFRHYKGAEYVVIALANLEAHSEEVYVVYKNEHETTVWCRPIFEFIAEIQTSHDKSVIRFQRVS